jgi:hypothetical protein
MGALVHRHDGADVRRDRQYLVARMNPGWVGRCDRRGLRGPLFIGESGEPLPVFPKTGTLVGTEASGNEANRRQKKRASCVSQR